MILLRDLIDVIAMDFRKRSYTEADLLQHCFSETMMSHLLRCFGAQHTIPSPRLSTFLVQCLLNDADRQHVEWNDEERDCIIDLKTSGIIVEDRDEKEEFTSPLAGRFYYRWQFWDRSYRDPSSLHGLIRSVIGNMSASELKFPTARTFQRLLLEGFVRFTRRNCLVCPELPHVFPPSTRSESDEDTFVFYLSGDFSACEWQQKQWS